MPLNPQCTGQPPMTKNYPAQDMHGAEVETCSSRSDDESVDLCHVSRALNILTHVVFITICCSCCVIITPILCVDRLRYGTVK